MTTDRSKSAQEAPVRKAANKRAKTPPATAAPAVPESPAPESLVPVATAPPAPSPSIGAAPAVSPPEIATLESPPHGFPSDGFPSLDDSPERPLERSPERPDASTASGPGVDLRAALKAHFGFDRFRPGQEAVISTLLEGRSAAAVFPTGSGKSLCYQLPALLLSGVTLVVSPLIALMKDQIDALTARGIPARRLDSTLDLEEYRATMRDVRAGRLRLLYVAPERFQNERFRETLRQIRVSLFAIDEAHCISEWGHNFRPDYLKLVEVARQCGAERVLALTATATPAVLEDVRRAFGIDEDAAVRTGVYRPNLTLLAEPVDADERFQRLVARLAERPRGATIVYVTLQRTAEEVAERLTRAGFAARPYHAGLKDELRSEIQDWFFAEPSAVVVATIAFGMGIDKSDIRYVYHYNLPKSLENYSQEIGRAGRDGEPSVCELLASADDLQVLENFVYGDTPTLGAIRAMIGELFDGSNPVDVSFYDLSGRHDIRLLVVRTLLTYLELEGYLAGGTPFYADYQLKPRISSERILAEFTGERREFLAALFRQVRKGRQWLRLDAHAAAQAIGAPRERIVRALEHLVERGWLELEAQGVRHRYELVRRPDDLDALAAELHARALDRERRELQRLNQVLELIEREDCQVAALCAYFGETLDQPCGHCSWCLNKGRRVRWPRRSTNLVDEQIVRQALHLPREADAALADPRVMARFLCGLASPLFTRKKLSGHRLFGALAHAPFAEVERRFSPPARP